MKQAILIAAGVAVWSSVAWGGGALTPPGAPAETMKTLDEVEPRTPISSLPYTISSPGSYYLTKNLTGVASQHGIVIEADDVTLDLNGFTLRGVSGSRDGIFADSDNTGVTVRNGVVQGWGYSGFNGDSATQCRFSDLKVRSNTQSGLVAGENAMVENCQVSLNGQVGIQIGPGGQVRDCMATYNGQRGISAQYGGSVADCTAAFNGTDGISVSSECVVKDNACQSNGSSGDGAGIQVDGNKNRVEGNHLTSADIGLAISGTDNYVADNTVMNNTINYFLSAGNQLNLLLSEIPETIRWPATVVLAGTLTGTSGADGVVIDADNVTLDLNGHSLVGVPGSLNGIAISTNSPFLRNITIRNGTVQNWGGDGVSCLFCENGTA